MARIREEQHCVYRLFDDDGALLYVGASNNVTGRLRSHTLKSWGDAIAMIRLAHYTTREEAAVAEAIAIVSESPMYNVDNTTSGRVAPGTRIAQIIGTLAAIGPATQVELERAVPFNDGRSQVYLALDRLVRQGRVEIVGERPSRSRWGSARVYALKADA